MATVHLAEERKHKRKVAIKVLKQEFGASVGAERFLREIGIAARLSHPHIVPLIDSGEAGRNRSTTSRRTFPADRCATGSSPAAAAVARRAAHHTQRSALAWTTRTATGSCTAM